MDFNFNVKFSDLTIKIVTQDSPTLSAKLDEIIVAQTKLGVQLMAISQSLLDVLAKIDAATNAIAAEITALQAQIATDMSAADVADLQTRLQASADRLTGIGANPAQPVPPASDPTVTPASVDPTSTP